MDENQISTLKSLLDSALVSLDETETRNYAVLDDLLFTIMRLRTIRNDSFPEGYFADTGWNILLDIYAAKDQDKGLCTTALDAKAPLATVIRYLKKLEKDGFIERFHDPRDRRRTMIKLTSMGREKMDNIFRETLSTKSTKPDDDLTGERVGDRILETTLD